MIDAWERFHCATLELVRSTPIKQRLVAAYRRNLVELREEQLPPEARAAFVKVLAVLCAVRPERGEDAVTASVRKMSAQQADDCAALIVDIFGLLSRDISAGSSRQSASVVQLRAIESSEFQGPRLIAAS